MTDIDVIVPVGVENRRLGSAAPAARRGAARGRLPPVVHLRHRRRRAGGARDARGARASVDDACVIQLSRRFGETAAILAGFASTKTER